MSLGGSYNSGGGGSKGGILKACSTPGSKKKVRWPDDCAADEAEEAAAGFSIARTPRQVRTRGSGRGAMPLAGAVGC